MMFRSWEIFNVFDIPVKLHWSFTLVLIYLVLFNPSFLFSIFNVIIILGLMGSVLLHELGHCASSKKFGIGVRQIYLSPIGGIAQLDSFDTDHHQEMEIALAGPLVSLGLGVVLVCISFPLFTITSYLGHLTFNLGFLNLMLFAFNLLPSFPMDGGRVFRAYLTPKKGKLGATQAAVTVGKWIAILFVVAGLYFGLPVLLFIATFVFLTAKMELRYVQARELQQPDFGVVFDVSPPPFEERKHRLPLILEGAFNAAQTLWKVIRSRSFDHL